MTEAVLDREHLRRYTAGDAALERELFELLRGQIERCCALMAGADEPVAWRDAAHMLKGGARGVGAMALGEACAEAESRPLDAAALEAVREAAAAVLCAMEEAGDQASQRSNAM